MTLSSKKRSQRSRFRDKLRFVPTPRLAKLLAGGAPLAAGAYAFDPAAGAIVFWAWNVTLAVFSILDVLSLPRLAEIRAERQAPEKADLGRPFAVQVKVHLAGSRLPSAVCIADDLPDTFVQESAPAVSTETEEFEFQYIVRPKERGRYRLRTLFVRLRGAYGLWLRQAHLPCEQEIKVLPDLSGVRGMLASMQRSLILEGKRVFRRPMSGTDFQSIRDYTPDDDPRSINWPATARTLSTKINLYQPERGKIVTLLIDCGRLMGVELDGQTKLDRSLEAALTLAAVALQRGDQVAVLTFAGRILSYIPPGKGMGHLQTIIDAVFDAKSDASESNYALALSHLARVQKKRSLLVLFTDMENALFESELAPYLIRLRRTHPVLMLCLQDPVLYEWSRIAVRRLKDAYVKSMAYKFMGDRRKFAMKMASQGIEVLDVPADELALAAVNSYLEMKARDAL